MLLNFEASMSFLVIKYVLAGMLFVSVYSGIMV